MEAAAVVILRAGLVVFKRYYSRTRRCMMAGRILWGFGGGSSIFSESNLQSFIKDIQSEDGDDDWHRIFFFNGHEIIPATMSSLLRLIYYLAKMRSFRWGSFI